MIASLPWTAGAASIQTLSVDDLLGEHWAGGIISNSAFMPPPDAAAERTAFTGSVSLSEAEMIIKPRPLSSRAVLGHDPGLFPGITLSFFTYHGDLVPFTQDVMRYGSVNAGNSFWDVIIQPGRVWSQAGDGEWSRAAFPFALVNSIEGETHNGLATFLYKPGKVSNLRFQIVQQTAPFYVKDRFLAAGTVPAAFHELSAGSTSQVESLSRLYASSLAEPVKVADWHELETQVGSATASGFDGRMPVRDIVLSGLDYHGTFYIKSCASAGGPLPWCDRARFGVWSATKALANETALLRLAAKYGPAVFDLKLKDFVPEMAGHPEWDNVRFQDAIDMATGIGGGSEQSIHNDISDGYLEDDYSQWYEARSVQEKVAALLHPGRAHSWGPGKVARYRDQDMFVLGVAMNNFLKSKEGPAADLWALLEKEVFGPIGIRYAPTNRTLEADGSPGQALMAYGYYPTIIDMVRIARLYQNGGKFGEAQILFAPRVAALMPGREPRGRPTGEMLTFGETTYGDAFWVTAYHAKSGCLTYYPRMIGWGGNIVALLPHGVTGIRLAKSDETPGHAEVDTAGMAAVADRLQDMCR